MVLTQQPCWQHPIGCITSRTDTALDSYFEWQKGIKTIFYGRPDLDLDRIGKSVTAQKPTSAIPLTGIRENRFYFSTNSLNVKAMVRTGLRSAGKNLLSPLNRSGNAFGRVRCPRAAPNTTRYFLIRYESWIDNRFWAINGLQCHRS